MAVAALTAMAVAAVEARGSGLQESPISDPVRTLLGKSHQSVTTRVDAASTTGTIYLNSGDDDIDGVYS